MRTTIVFDPDVAAELRRRREQGAAGTLREDVNELIRLGLAGARERAQPRERFSTPTFDTGELLFPIGDVEAAIVHAEGSGHR